MPLSNKSLPLLPLLEKFITDSSSGKRLTPSGKRICKETITQYAIVYHLLEQYEKLQLTILSIRVLKTSSQRILKSEKNYWKKFFRSFTNWLYQKKYFDLYVGAISKILRTFFNYLLKEQCLTIGNFHNQFKIPLQQLTPIVLEPWQLKFFTNINKQLKLLIEKAGWDYNLPKIRNRMGNPVEIKNKKGNTYRFCDHITAHTMRRTAITTLLLMGVEENIVRSISGHTAGSKEFYKYVAVVQNFVTSQVMNAFDKLMKLS